IWWPDNERCRLLGRARVQTACWTMRLMRPRPARISPLRMFGLVLRQELTRKLQSSLALEPVPEEQQLGALAAELPGELGRRDFLGHRAEDPQQLAGTAMRLLKGRARPRVKHAPTLPALVVHHGLAPTAVHA